MSGRLILANSLSDHAGRSRQFQIFNYFKYISMRQLFDRDFDANDHFFRHVLAVGLAVWVSICSLQECGASTSARWQEGYEKVNSLGLKSVNLGIANQIVVGHWVPIHVEFNQVLPETINQLVITVPDGAGIRHRYLIDNAGGNQSFSNVIRLGRSASPIDISLLDKDQQVVFSQRWHASTIAESHVYHPSVRPVYLNLGSNLEINRNLGHDRTGSRRDEDVYGIHLVDPKHLPETALGYDSIEKIIITTLNQDNRLLENLSEKQINAIFDWVASGGQLVISSGLKVEQYFSEGGRLQPFSTSPLLGVTEIQNTGRLESFVGSREPLLNRTGEPIAAAQVSGEGSIVILRDRNGPMIAKKSIGFGVVTFLAIDLDDTRVLAWSDFPRLLAIMLSHEFDAERSARSDVRSGRVTHIGFEDISGQLRGALDQFRDIYLVNFTIVAVLIGLFLVLVGPLDYFLLNRVFKRMELTWITFPLITAGFCGLAYWLHSATRPATIRVNQVEVIDVDETTQLIRGSVWAHIFSPTDRNCELQLSENRFAAYTDSQWFSWQGLPGTGLGGMQNQSNWRGAEYTVTENPGPDETDFPDWFKSRRTESSRSQRDGFALQAFPFQSSSTSSFTGQWIGTTELAPSSRLEQNQNRSELTGTLTNPFDFDLEDAVIIHHETAYAFRRPIGAGETISVESDTRRRSLRSFFTNVRKADGEDTRKSWDIYSFEIPDIVEMMMFFDVANGQFYTKLSNQYVSDIDLSHLLELDRAILVGRTKQAVSTIMLDQQQSLTDSLDQQWTFVRITLPVASK